MHRNLMAFQSEAQLYTAAKCCDPYHLECKSNVKLYTLLPQNDVKAVSENTQLLLVYRPHLALFYYIRYMNILRPT